MTAYLACVCTSRGALREAIADLWERWCAEGARAAADAAEVRP